MNHGYARVTDDGRIILGFSEDAPIFKQLAADKPNLPLKMAKYGDEIVGFTVVKSEEGNGFLWYPHERDTAQKSARNFCNLFDNLYLCIPLTL